MEFSLTRTSQPFTQLRRLATLSLVLLTLLSVPAAAQDEASVLEAPPDSAALARQGGSPIQLPTSSASPTASRRAPVVLEQPAEPFLAFDAA